MGWRLSIFVWNVNTLRPHTPACEINLDAGAIRTPHREIKLQKIGNRFEIEYQCGSFALVFDIDINRFITVTRDPLFRRKRKKSEEELQKPLQMTLGDIPFKVKAKKCNGKH